MNEQTADCIRRLVLKIDNRFGADLKTASRRQHDLRSRRDLARRKNKTSENAIYALNYGIVKFL